MFLSIVTGLFLSNAHARCSEKNITLQSWKQCVGTYSRCLQNRSCSATSCTQIQNNCAQLEADEREERRLASPECNGQTKGIIIYDNVFTGALKRCLPHGQGTMVYSDGKKYIGAFHDGSRHGEGKLLNKDGSLFYSGKWMYDTTEAEYLQEEAEDMHILQEQIDSTWE